MSITGFQYYWIVAIGLLVGLALAIGIGITGPFSTRDPLVAIPLLVAFLYATIASLIVFFEIWDRYGIGAALAAGIVFPALIVYWFSRIRGTRVGD
jgi:predicted MFS family arabinose efflux permease